MGASLAIAGGVTWVWTGASEGGNEWTDADNWTWVGDPPPPVLYPSLPGESISISGGPACIPYDGLPCPTANGNSSCVPANLIKDAQAISVGSLQISGNTRFRGLQARYFSSIKIVGTGGAGTRTLLMFDSQVIGGDPPTVPGVVVTYD